MARHAADRCRSVGWYRPAGDRSLTRQQPTARMFAPRSPLTTFVEGRQRTPLDVRGLGRVVRMTAAWSEGGVAAPPSALSSGPCGTTFEHLRLVEPGRSARTMT